MPTQNVVIPPGSEPRLKGSAAATNLNTTLSLVDGTSYTVFVHASPTRCFFAETPDSATSIPPFGIPLIWGEIYTVRPRDGETIWAWSPGTGGCVLVVSESP